MSNQNGWIGVELDGTLAEYHGLGFAAAANGGKIGAPIPKMVERVQLWLAQDREVKIFTARVSGMATDSEAYATVIAAIRAWCYQHIGRWIPITCTKDFKMVELWDGRGVQVVPNTGERADVRGPLGRFIASIAHMNYDGEVREGEEPFVMENDDAVETLNSLIHESRKLLGWRDE